MWKYNEMLNLIKPYFLSFQYYSTTEIKMWYHVELKFTDKYNSRQGVNGSIAILRTDDEPIIPLVRIGEL